MESRQETQCSLNLCLISTGFSAESQPHSYSIDGLTERTHTFWAGNRTEPARNILTLIFSLWIRDGAVRCFPGSWSGEYLRSCQEKLWTIISISRSCFPGIQSSTHKWKNAASSEQLWSNCTWVFWKEFVADGMSRGWKIRRPLNPPILLRVKKSKFAAVDSKLAINALH